MNDDVPELKLVMDVVDRSEQPAGRPETSSEGTTSTERPPSEETSNHLGLNISAKQHDQLDHQTLLLQETSTASTTTTDNDERRQYVHVSTNISEAPIERPPLHLPFQISAPAIPVAQNHQQQSSPDAPVPDTPGETLAHRVLQQQRSPDAPPPGENLAHPVSHILQQQRSPDPDTPGETLPHPVSHILQQQRSPDPDTPGETLPHHVSHILQQQRPPDVPPPPALHVETLAQPVPRGIRTSIQRSSSTPPSDPVSCLDRDPMIKTTRSSVSSDAAGDRPNRAIVRNESVIIPGKNSPKEVSSTSSSRLSSPRRGPDRGISTQAGDEPKSSANDPGAQIIQGIPPMRSYDACAFPWDMLSSNSSSSPRRYELFRFLMSDEHPSRDQPKASANERRAQREVPSSTSRLSPSLYYTDTDFELANENRTDDTASASHQLDEGLGELQGVGSGESGNLLSDVSTQEEAPGDEGARKLFNEPGAPIIIGTSSDNNDESSLGVIPSSKVQSPRPDASASHNMDVRSDSALAGNQPKADVGKLFTKPGVPIIVGMLSSSDESKSKTPSGEPKLPSPRRLDGVRRTESHSSTVSDELVDSGKEELYLPKSESLDDAEGMEPLGKFEEEHPDRDETDRKGIDVEVAGKLPARDDESVELPGERTKHMFESTTINIFYMKDDLSTVEPAKEMKAFEDESPVEGRSDHQPAVSSVSRLYELAVAAQATNTGVPEVKPEDSDSNSSSMDMEMRKSPGSRADSVDDALELRGEKKTHMFESTTINIFYMKDEPAEAPKAPNGDKVPEASHVLQTAVSPQDKLVSSATSQTGVGVPEIKLENSNSNSNATLSDLAKLESRPGSPAKLVGDTLELLGEKRKHLFESTTINIFYMKDEVDSPPNEMKDLDREKMRQDESPLDGTKARSEATPSHHHQQPQDEQAVPVASASPPVTPCFDEPASSMAFGTSRQAGAVPRAVTSDQLKVVYHQPVVNPEVASQSPALPRAGEVPATSQRVVPRYAGTASEQVPGADEASQQVGYSPGVPRAELVRTAEGLSQASLGFLQPEITRYVPATVFPGGFSRYEAPAAAPHEFRGYHQPGVTPGVFPPYGSQCCRCQPGRYEAPAASQGVPWYFYYEAPSSGLKKKAQTPQINQAKEDDHLPRSMPNNLIAPRLRRKAQETELDEEEDNDNLSPKVSTSEATRLRKKVQRAELEQEEDEYLPSTSKACHLKTRVREAKLEKEEEDDYHPKSMPGTLKAPGLRRKEREVELEQEEELSRSMLMASTRLKKETREAGLEPGEDYDYLRFNYPARQAGSPKRLDRGGARAKLPLLFGRRVLPSSEMKIIKKKTVVKFQKGKCFRDLSLETRVPGKQEIFRMRGLMPVDLSDTTSSSTNSSGALSEGEVDPGEMVFSSRK